MKKCELYLSDEEARLITHARPGQPVVITPIKEDKISDIDLILAKEAEIQRRYGVYRGELVYIQETPAVGY